jgi:hypothetical protein
MDCKSRRGDQHTTRNNEYAYSIHACADDLHDVPKTFHCFVHSRKVRSLSILFLGNALSRLRQG